MINSDDDDDGDLEILRLNFIPCSLEYFQAIADEFGSWSGEFSY